MVSWIPWGIVKVRCHSIPVKNINVCIKSPLKVNETRLPLSPPLGFDLSTKSGHCPMFIYVGGGGGTKAAVHVHNMSWNRVCLVQSDAKIVKADFCSFRYTFDQNTLLKTSQTIRKCDQECSSEQMGFKVALYPSRPLRCRQKFAQFTQAHGEIQYGCWLEKTDGFSFHSCHDHIKIHVCGVLKRNGIMLKNTRLQRNEHQSLKAMIIERWEMFIQCSRSKKLCCKLKWNERFTIWKQR